MAHNKHNFLIVALSWTVLITYLSLATIGKIKVAIAIPNKDKIGHFVFYFVFVIVWILFFKIWKPYFDVKKIVLIAIFYGIMMEVFQAAFTTNRSPDILDVLANMIGAIAGFIFFKSSQKNFYKKISR